MESGMDMVGLAVVVALGVLCLYVSVAIVAPGSIGVFWFAAIGTVAFLTLRDLRRGPRA